MSVCHPGERCAVLPTSAYDWPVITASEFRDARVRAGYRTQRDIAEALNVSLRTVTAWEAEGGRVPAKEEQRVRALLWPGPAPLSAYDDWELLSEIGRRLQRVGVGIDNTQVGPAPNPDTEIPPNPQEQEQDERASGQLKLGRGARKPHQR